MAVPEGSMRHGMYTYLNEGLDTCLDTCLYACPWESRKTCPHARPLWHMSIGGVVGYEQPLAFALSRGV